MNIGISVKDRDGVLIDTSWRPEGVTEQFLGEADTYDRKYANDPYWTWLVSNALNRLAIPLEDSLNILDIGSGSGNTISPLLRLLPNSKIVASDISPQLLGMLIRRHNISAYCFDLHKDFFAPASFDGIFGGAILHHMLDPTTALRNAAKWVKPNGWIALIEPLEVGHLALASLFHLLIGETDDPELISILCRLVEDFEARYGVRVRPWHQDLDDKWFFSPRRVRAMAEELGFREWSMEPVHMHAGDIYKNHTLALLKLCGYTKPLSENLLSIIQDFDAMPERLKIRLDMDGVLIFRR